MTQGSQSIERALTLLEAIVIDDGQTPVAEIVAKLGLRASSGRRLIAALKKRNLIQAVAHGRYAGGARLMALIQKGHPHRILIEGARPLLRQISRATGWTTHLGILDNDMVTYLVKEGGDELFTREGAQLEAYCTGIGKVLLAHLPGMHLQTYLSGGPFVKMTPSTIIEPADLERELSQIRQRGFAIDDCEMSDNLVCVAVPIFKDKICFAAISMSGTVDIFPLSRSDAIAARLQRAAISLVQRVETYGMRG